MQFLLISEIGVHMLQGSGKIMNTTSMYNYVYYRIFLIYDLCKKTKLRIVFKILQN